jgi:carboxymethylenebutenolidase
MSIESIEIDGVPMRIAHPADKPTAAVLVLHQAVGYSPQISRWLGRLADNGYLGVAPNLLHRRGVDTVEPFSQFGGDMAAFAAFLPNDSDMLADVSSTLAYLASVGISDAKTGIVGFSYGGRASYVAATEKTLGAAVTFYGNGIQAKSFEGNDGLPALSGKAADLKTPWLGLFGEQDFLLAPGELDQLEQELGNAGTPTEVVRYPAGHAFDVEEPFAPGMPSFFVAEAADDAIARTLQFLDKSLR